VIVAFWTYKELPKKCREELQDVHISPPLYVATLPQFMSFGGLSAFGDPKFAQMTQFT
jgi:hypothetical protein